MLSMGFTEGTLTCFISLTSAGARNRGGQPYLHDWSLNNNSELQGASESRRLVILYVCCHTWLPGELSAVHNATGRGQV